MTVEGLLSADRVRWSAMGLYTCLHGSELVKRLMTDDRMAPDEARTWIAAGSGQPFDPLAMYKLRWPEASWSPGYRNREGLSFHVMSNAELARDEQDYRRENKLPPKEFWEPWMNESARNRSRLDQQKHTSGGPDTHIASES